MKPILKKYLPYLISAAGLVVGIVIIAIAFNLPEPPQCPSNVEPTHGECIIGANVGLVLYGLIAFGVWFACNVAATALIIIRLSRQAGFSIRRRVVYSLAIVAIAGVVTAVPLILLGSA